MDMSPRSRRLNRNEVLSIDEIKACDATDWVLIGEPETDEFQHVRAGTVLFHSPDREEVYRKAIDLRSSHFASRYLGEFPEGHRVCPVSRAFSAKARILDNRQEISGGS